MKIKSSQGIFIALCLAEIEQLFAKIFKSISTKEDRKAWRLLKFLHNIERFLSFITSRVFHTCDGDPDQKCNRDEVPHDHWWWSQDSSTLHHCHQLTLWDVIDDVDDDDDMVVNVPTRWQHWTLTDFTPELRLLWSGLWRPLHRYQSQPLPTPMILL